VDSGSIVFLRLCVLRSSCFDPEIEIALSHTSVGVTLPSPESVGPAPIGTRTFSETENLMRISINWLRVSAIASGMMISTLAQAAKTYQVTGVITALTAKVITVQKPNDEKWEIDRDDSTKSPAISRSGRTSPSNTR